MTLDEHREEARKLVRLLAAKQGIRLEDKHWADLEPLIEESAQTQHRIEQQYLSNLRPWFLMNK